MEQNIITESKWFAGLASRARTQLRSYRRIPATKMALPKIFSQGSKVGLLTRNTFPAYSPLGTFVHDGLHCKARLKTSMTVARYRYRLDQPADILPEFCHKSTGIFMNSFP